VISCNLLLGMGTTTMDGSVIMSLAGTSMFS
jgi:hypothetical protein